MATLIGIAGLSLNAQGQRLYDKTRDEQAQQAKQQAAELKSDPVFETQLKNLTTLEALDVETAMTHSKRDTRSVINSFVEWEHVFTAVETARTDLAQSDGKAASKADIDAARAALKDQIQKAKDAIKKLRDNANTTEDQRLAMLFAHVGEIDSLLTMAKQLIGKGDDSTTVNALDKTSATLKEITDLYARYDARVKEITGLKTHLGEFYTSLQEATLRGLEAQEEHLTILGTIETQRSLELAEARELIAIYDADKDRLLNVYYGRCFSHGTANLKKERITDTVNLAMTMANCKVTGTLDPNTPTIMRPRDVVEDIMLLLYRATTIVSRVPTSIRLAQLRSDQEAHRFAIKQRILEAHAYELILNGGADRLALFYKGGIKPTQLAQLIFNVANVATPIAIFAK